MLLSAAFAVLLGAKPVQPFELKDGDRVVLLGGTMVEREPRYGHWEAALHVAFPKVNFTVRNLGWSGDTVWGESRARFDFNKPDAGFKQLVDQTLELKPTVLIIAYGANESFAGKAGVPAFVRQYGRLLDALVPAKARLTVLMSPLPYEIGRGKVPGIDERNRELARYAEAVGTLAADRGLIFADLFEEVWKLYVVCDKMNGPARAARDWWYTDNGVHLRASGYDRTAPLFLKALGLGDTHNGFRPPALEAAIVAKNEQFFNKWRPQNETYLFGFRKHEQGKNAKEIAEFDPFIAKAEAEIAKQLQQLKK